MKLEHRAREYMLSVAREIPGIWSCYEKARQESELLPGVYLSEQDGAGAYADAIINAHGVQAIERLRQLDELSVARIISPINTVAAWRMTQGIYRFDPSLYESLIETTLTGDLPADVLHHLPEWCLYLETPGLHALRIDHGKAPIAGAWVRADHEPDGTPSLIFTLDIIEAQRPESHTILLDGSLESAVADTLNMWGMHSKEVAEGIAKCIRPLINLVLYLVGTEDIRGASGMPSNPSPKRTRRNGMKLFAAEGLRQWDVGVRMGAALRSAYRAAESGEGGTHAGPRPHVRRAHWHSYWTGKIDTEDRRLVPRWLPPIPVNLTDIDALPSVVRKV